MSTTYTIQSGDTFSYLSQKLNILLSAFEAVNPGLNLNDLQIGQQINIIYYVVSGDTLNAISARLGCQIGALEAANLTVNPNDLLIGSWLALPPLNSGSGNGGGNGGGPGSGLPNKGGNYVVYSGSASNYPDPSTWISYGSLWQSNSILMGYNESSSLVNLIGSAINQVAVESGVDARAILCVIMQESGGNVYVPTTSNGVTNPGIMQSHNGVAFDPNNPAGSILQMVRDGTEGTSSGAGLLQLLQQWGGNYYDVFRAYNSGNVDTGNLNDPVGATASYVCDMANRLLGHTWPGM